MKILYLLSHDIFLNDGITKKVKSQTDVWIKYGHDVRVFNIIVRNNRKSGISPLRADIFSRKNVIFGSRKLLSAIEEYNPDVIYFRYEPYKPFLSKILSSYPSVIELNTDDLAETLLESSQSLRKFVRYYYNKGTRHFILDKASGFIGVTEEIIKLQHFKKYGKPSIAVPNSINLNGYQIVKKDLSTQIPRILFMGRPGFTWHGLDKILKLSELTCGKLEFHIIGYDKPLWQHYSNVTFHGYLAKSEYEKIIEQCDIGLSSTAFHRIPIQEASPLKVREYLAYGLPVILPYKDTMLSDLIKPPEWILEIPNSQNNLIDNIEKIIDFSYSMQNYIVKHDQSKFLIDAFILEEKKMKFLSSLI